jgi:hypothetical protein
MARKVKCVITKEYGTSDVFYKAPNGRYYKTEDIYNEYEFEKKCRLLLLDKFVDLLGYYNTAQFPTILPKEIKELHNTFTYKVMLKTFNRCLKNIQYALNNKNFTTEYGKIKYILAIIKNKINEVNKEEQRQTQYKTTQCVNINILNDKKTNTRRHKDISSFLEDDE